MIEMPSSGGVDHHPKKIIPSNSVKIELREYYFSGLPILCIFQVSIL